MTGLPPTKCLFVAITTPIGPDLRPDHQRLIARIRRLFDQGCDGVALFGTTGEGPAFSVEDRTEALSAVVAAGIDPQKIIVSVSALPVVDVVHLARQATELGVHGVLLMPLAALPMAATEDGTFDFYKTVIDRVERPDLRLYLYHFPDISGVPVTPSVIRRLDERYPATIAGVKDSGGDSDYTEMLVRRFSHLSVFTGSEIHLPELLSTGVRGTICGLANAMPRLIRVMMDLPTAFDRRQLLQAVFAGDTILSRRPFVPSVKAIVAAELDDPDWRRVMAPLSDVPVVERRRMVADFTAWDSRLPPDCRSLEHDEPPLHEKVVPIRRA
jgi:4-hydroxy-tetrahydrodipicolinate synthase